MNWPSEITTGILLYGLPPLFYVTYLAVIDSFSLVSLRSAFVIFNWLTFQASGWLGLSDGIWQSILIAEEYVDDCLLFSVLASYLFLLGHSFTAGFQVWSRSGLNLPEQIKKFKIESSWIFALCLLTILTWLPRIDGIDNIFYAEYSRGQRQFEKVGDWYILRNWFAISNSIIAFGLAVVASMKLAQALTFQRGAAAVTGVVGLLIASIPRFHGFSRAAGYAFILSALALFCLGPKRHFPKIALLVLIGFWMCWVGYEYRSFYKPGVASYIEASIESLHDLVQNEPAANTNNNQANWMAPRDNIFNHIDSWTRVAFLRDRHRPELASGLEYIASVLQPLPSALVSFPVRIGKDLAVAVGAGGRVGITTPASAELFFALGWYALIAYLIFGSICGFIDRRTFRGIPRFVFLHFFFFLAILIGIQGGLRPMTRPILYGYLIVIFAGLVFSRSNASTASDRLTRSRQI